jgi:AcrR family transcriptional regulator
MARWEPNTRERLERAALELFGERGYQHVTVAEIAERAGLSKPTYFRHFADKREVLFWGQDTLVELFTRAVAEAAEGAAPLAMVACGLDAIAPAFTSERHELAVLREAVIDQSVDLRERLAFKQQVLTTAVADALRTRGVDDPVAVLAAHTGVLAFGTAYHQWAASPSSQDFGLFTKEALRGFASAARVLSHSSQDIGA